MNTLLLFRYTGGDTTYRRGDTKKYKHLKKELTYYQMLMLLQSKAHEGHNKVSALPKQKENTIENRDSKPNIQPQQQPGTNQHATTPVSYQNNNIIASKKI